MFFESWTGLGRIVLVGVLAYVALIAIIRVSGKRTLSKMNAFDLIVTVALGSTLATILLSKDVPLAEGVAAFLLLVSLQYVVAWSSIRSDKVQRLVKSDPKLLAHRGELCRSAMRIERVTESEVHAAIRAGGLAALDDVQAVVLETDGTFSVIPRGRSEGSSALEYVRGFEDAMESRQDRSDSAAA